jgi:hypothetical protein
MSGLPGAVWGGLVERFCPEETWAGGASYGDRRGGVGARGAQVGRWQGEGRWWGGVGSAVARDQEAWWCMEMTQVGWNSGGMGR